MTVCQTHTFAGGESSSAERERDRAINASAGCFHTGKGEQIGEIFLFPSLISKIAKKKTQHTPELSLQVGTHSGRLTGASVFNANVANNRAGTFVSHVSISNATVLERFPLPRSSGSVPSVAQVRRRWRVPVQTSERPHVPSDSRKRPRKRTWTAAIWRTDPAAESCVCGLDAEAGRNADIAATAHQTHR